MQGVKAIESESPRKTRGGLCKQASITQSRRILEGTLLRFAMPAEYNSIQYSNHGVFLGLNRDPRFF